MKQNMFDAMDKLEIDLAMMGLIRQMWKHGYRTRYSCDGDNQADGRAYVSYFDGSGDGWFEENAWRFGLNKIENRDCCQREFQDEVRKFGFNPEDFADKREFCGCGAGVNGMIMYRGKLLRPFARN